MKPKYNIGDELWILRNGKAVQVIISGVLKYTTSIEKARFMYREGINKEYSPYFGIEETDLFKTKEDLIASI